MNNENKHFLHIFWFVVGLTVVAFGYNIALSFIELPEKNVRFADTFQGFLLGTALSTGINYLIGNSVNKTKAPDAPTTDSSTNTTNIIT